MINQDSVLIKHDFDAGKSRILKNHEMTKAAQIRMQHLIAMLRDKTGKNIKNLAMEPIPIESESEPEELSSPQVKGKDKNLLSPTRMITMQSTMVDEIDKDFEMPHLKELEKASKRRRETF